MIKDISNLQDDSYRRKKRQDKKKKSKIREEEKEKDPSLVAAERLVLSTRQRVTRRGAFNKLNFSNRLSVIPATWSRQARWGVSTGAFYV